MSSIVILASGSGTNAENLIRYFANSREINVKLAMTNNPNALVIQRMKKLGIPTIIFNDDELVNGSVLKILKENSIDYIILAGFLKLIPENIIKPFSGRILNIHPALLPKYGGKGMYGMRVHEAVIAAGESESGITIHLVNERYDEGDTIFQVKCPVLPNDTPQALADRVHQLEYQHFPEVVQRFVEGRKMDF